MSLLRCSNPQIASALHDAVRLAAKAWVDRFNLVHRRLKWWELLWRDNLDENGASIWMRRGGRAD